MNEYRRHGRRFRGRELSGGSRQNASDGIENADTAWTPSIAVDIYPAKILIMGLPGAGKTTLAVSLAQLLNAVHFNADAVRANICRDLGFSLADRIEQARRIGWLCDQVVAAGHVSIADLFAQLSKLAQPSAKVSSCG